MSEDWRALGAEAARLLSDKRWPEAVAAFERVVALNPGHADSWFNLGYALRHARKYGAALDAYAQAIALGVRGAEEAHLNRAVILSEHLHRIDDARTELQDALRLNPNLTAAWLNLGNLEEDLGNREAAAAAYRGALAVEPDNGRAFARLTGLEGNLAAIEKLRTAIERVRPGGEDEAELRFALGNALDAEGQYREAFATFTAANELAAAVRPIETRYDPRRQEELVDALIETFSEPIDGSGAPPVIFICGMFRSGSTLVEQLLGRHPRIAAGGELEFLPAMVGEELQPYPKAAADLSPGRLNELADHYLADVEALFPNAEFVTDKRPDNFLHLGLIKSLFPGAKVVHTVRNPLDTIISAYALYFAETVSYSERIDDLVHYYVQYRRLMAHWKSLYGNDIFDVDYDRLVGDPKAPLEALLRFLGVDWDDACLDHRAEASTIRTASVWQVRQPLHRRSSGRWRNYASELASARHKLAKHGLIEDVD